MKYLSFLNISNIDNINCDSGYIFQRQLGLSLIELGHAFTLVIPSILDDSSINIRYHDFGSNKFQVRYSFNWEKISEIIKTSEVDVIISNQSELSANIKSLLISEKLDIKLYTYIHYFPFSLTNSGQIIFDSSLNNKNFCQSVLLSFISGLLASDKILVHSRYSIFLLHNLIKHFNISINSDNISILPPPYDNYIAEGTLFDNDNKHILYNHRLYKQYGTEFLLKFVEEIKKHDSYKVVITDLLFNRNIKRTYLDTSVDLYRSKLLLSSNIIYRTDGNDREIYRKIICSSKIALAPYRKNCTWSMSVIDCLSVGLPVVAPKFAWFKEFIPNQLQYSSKKDLQVIIKKLFCDRHFYSDMSLLVRDITVNTNKLSGRYIASEFASIR